MFSLYIYAHVLDAHVLYARAFDARALYTHVLSLSIYLPMYAHVLYARALYAHVAMSMRPMHVSQMPRCSLCHVTNAYMWRDHVRAFCDLIGAFFGKVRDEEAWHFRIPCRAAHSGPSNRNRIKNDRVQGTAITIPQKL